MDRHCGIVCRMGLIVLGCTAAMAAGFCGTGYAGNGTRMIGFSARDSAMAGATTASSEDTSCLVRNPAGLAVIGNRVDLEYVNILPHDVSMHTEGPANILVPPGVTIPMPNIGLRQKSTVKYIPAGDAGISYRFAGTDARPVAVGCGIFTMSGIAVNYPSPRTNTILIGGGDYDKTVDLRSMRIAPGLAMAITDKFYFGAAANIGIQALKTDLATAPSFAETSGDGKWSYAPGAGYTLGLLSRFNERFALGASYESHGWFAHHYDYKDCLPYIDEPPVISVGLSLKPVEGLELTYDTRYINWTDSKLARLKPNEGGFGWQDQWVFAAGAEYTFCDRLKARLGYNYGKSPIQSHVAYANALFPVIMEHHFTTGFSFLLTSNLSLDAVWEHHFMGVKADNGCGDVYSRNGAGTKITAAADLIGGGIGYKF